MNKNNRGANINVGQMLLDILVLTLSFAITLLIQDTDVEADVMRHIVTMFVIFVFIYILSLKEAKAYDVTLFFYMDRFIKLISNSWLMAAAVTAMVMFVISPNEKIRAIYVTFLIVSYIMLCLNMIVSRFFSFILHDYDAPRVAYVGVFSDYQKFNYFLNKTSIKQMEVGYILKSGQTTEEKFNILGTVDELEDIIRSKELDQIFFLHKSSESMEDIQPYIELCTEMGVTVKVVIDSYDSYLDHKTSTFVSSVGTYPVITYHTICLNNYEQAIKRAMDVVISLVAIVISSPIMIITAIAIKIDDPGPVLFRQTRIGQNGRQFKVLKFRSMCVDAEAKKAQLMAQNEMQGGVMFKIKDDPRITRVGRFIRKTSIDELPQLFNVLGGSMSLVGTRPPTVDEVAKYKTSHWRRISIKPGITGMWQVSGRSDITDFDKIVELDLRYIDNWSLWLDIKLLFRTVGVVLGHKGSY